MEEFRETPAAADDSPLGAGAAARAADAPKAKPLSELANDADGGLLMRWSTGIAELDRVLGGMTEETPGSDGSSSKDSPANATAAKSPAAPAKSVSTGGGIVPGSAILLGGDPGIGKSTLLLQAARKLAASGRRTLYVTSEESAAQLRLRAERVGADGDTGEQLFVLADTNVARILEQARQVRPDVMIVDSIQMIYQGDLAAAPGSVTQLRSCTQEMTYFAKSSGCAVVFVGHVTKEGRLAGPRLLEHMVDTVLYFEGDRYHSHRILRAIKNRFGATLEVGLFEMTGAGLEEASNHRGLLADEYQPMAGSVVCPVMQGTRCLLVEIQALTVPGFPGSVKRKVSGVDGSRLAMLIAVLEKRGGMQLSDQDVFASSVGGMKVSEPGADLAVALAITGAHMNRQPDVGTCAVGEIGLGGELRHVQQLEQRIREAARLGFDHIICPKSRVTPPSGCTLHPVARLDEAIQLLQ